MSQSHDLNLSQASRLLSESHSDECTVSILVRKHSRSYADEQNWCSTPTERVEAGGGA